LTSLERLTTAANGGDVDQKPEFKIGLGDCADAHGVQLNELAALKAACPEAAALVRVASPLGRAMAKGIDIHTQLHDDPAEGAEVLDGLVSETRTAMTDALDQGADGICYEIEGASPEFCTPMQFGGHFLELDRELMEEISEAKFNMMWIKPKRDPYLDFVSDIPAHALAWDMNGSGRAPAEIRTLREGALAGDHPDADIRFLMTETPAVNVQMTEGAAS
jgi:hypothetical protein